MHNLCTAKNVLGGFWDRQRGRNGVLNIVIAFHHPISKARNLLKMHGQMSWLAYRMRRNRWFEKFATRWAVFAVFSTATSTVCGRNMSWPLEEVWRERGFRPCQRSTQRATPHEQNNLCARSIHKCRHSGHVESFVRLFQQVGTGTCSVPRCTFRYGTMHWRLRLKMAWKRRNEELQRKMMETRSSWSIHSPCTTQTAGTY